VSWAAGQPIRKLVDRSAASPVFDGTRVLFLAGAVAATGVPTGISDQPERWSVRPDGRISVRRGGSRSVPSLRLDGVWPDGRYLMHVRADSDPVPHRPAFDDLAPSSLLRRAVVSSDRSDAIVSAVRDRANDLTRGSVQLRMPSSYCSTESSAPMPGYGGARSLETSPRY